MYSSAKEIEALGSKSLADVVRMLPSLNVESNGREGTLASLFSRGGALPRSQLSSSSSPFALQNRLDPFERRCYVIQLEE